MEAFFQFLQNNLPFLFTYKLTFLFLGAAIEGFNVLILSGILISVGAVPVLPTIGVTILGNILNGYMWYLIGYFAGAKPIDRWGRKDEKSRVIIEKVERYFDRYSGRALIITRMTLSLTVATLIMAGSLKYNIKKFSLYNFLGAVGWVGTTLAVGYFFGESYKLLFGYVKSFTILTLITAATVILIYALRLFFKSTLIKSMTISEKLQQIGDKLKDGLDNIF